MTTIDISTPADAGFWREALAFSPCLKVAEYVGRQIPNGSGLMAPVDPFHANPTSAEEAHDHA